MESLSSMFPNTVKLAREAFLHQPNWNKYFFDAAFPSPSSYPGPNMGLNSPAFRHDDRSAILPSAHPDAEQRPHDILCKSRSCYTRPGAGRRRSLLYESNLTVEQVRNHDSKRFVSVRVRTHALVSVHVGVSKTVAFAQRHAANLRFDSPMSEPFASPTFHSANVHFERPRTESSVAH